MKDNQIIYKTVKTICYPFFMLLYHPTIINKKYLPKKEGFILAGNHKKNWDVFVLIAANKRKVHFFTKIELFNTKLKKWFFTSMGCIPVDRKTKNKGSVEQGIKYLNDDKVIGIFPEGTHNKTKEIIMPFKMGAVKMALEANKRIVPFAIVGEYKIFGKGIKVIFGKPYEIKSSDLEKENQILMDRVIELIKEYQK